MPQFRAVPAVPENLQPALADFLQAVKEDLEIFMGQRGPGRAMTNDAVGAAPQLFSSVTTLTARGDSVTAGNYTLATADDHRRLMEDVQKVIVGLNTIQNAFNALLESMRK